PEDLLGCREVHQIAGGGGFRLAAHPLCRDGRLVAKAQRKLSGSLGQSRVRGAELDVATAGDGPVRIEEAREDCPPLRRRGTQVGRGDVLIAEYPKGSKLRAESSDVVRVPLGVRGLVSGSLDCHDDLWVRGGESASP